MQDLLGDRMKSQYENRTRFELPRRTFTIIRLDGKSFHTYTRGLKKPFDNDLSDDIDKAIITILPQIQGAQFAYTQSDEISILLTDFATIDTDAWFDGNLQKMVSVSASLMTGEFNRFRARRWSQGLRAEMALAKLEQDDFSELSEYTIPETCIFKIANFDSRVFTIPDRIEVMNYFIWRNNDCQRNSLSMVAQSRFSHADLQGMHSLDMREMLAKVNINFYQDFSDAQKYGRLIVKENYTVLSSHQDPEGLGIVRSRWVSQPAWQFARDRDRLLKLIPDYPL